MTAAALEVHRLHHAYPDGTAALNGIDLAVQPGERVAVLGPNGAGKTTFMLHLNGLLEGEGIVRVSGLDVGAKTLREVRRRVGLVFQDPDDQLFMPTVRQDVAFGPAHMGWDSTTVETRTRDALDAVRMWRAADRAPQQLSMGERRRVAIATVLAMDPDLIVLDEPSANLDPRARGDLVDLLAELDRTMLVVTHDLPLAAETCERAVIIAGGVIRADGPCRTILGDPDLLALYDLCLPPGCSVDHIPFRGRGAPRGCGAPGVSGVSAAAAARPCDEHAPA